GSLWRWVAIGWQVPGQFQADPDASLLVGVSNSVSVAQRPAIHDEFAPLVDRGKCISRCQRNELFAPASISGLISTAVTRPFGATASAARSATEPVPVPRSSTCWPDLR